MMTLSEAYRALTPEQREQVDRLRQAGCKCSIPLLGYRPGVGPRCRLCNVVAPIVRRTDP
jgi:hypothetical protein